MVVLLVGGGSVLMNAMIDKLNKNGHRVYPVSYTHLRAHETSV